MKQLGKAIICFCRECGNDHLPRDSPSRPLPRDKTTLNVVETILSSFENDIASLNVLTRAQAKQQRVGDSSQMETKKKPKKRKRRKTPKNKTLSKFEDEALNKENENKPQNKTHTISKTSSGDSVLMEKMNENLEAILKAFDARITPETILPKNLQEYPNPI